MGSDVEGRKPEVGRWVRNRGSKNRKEKVGGGRDSVTQELPGSMTVKSEAPAGL